MRRSSEQVLIAALTLIATTGCGAPAPHPPPKDAPVEMTATEVNAALKGSGPMPTRAVLRPTPMLDLRAIDLGDAQWRALRRLDVSGAQTLQLGPPAMRAGDVEALCSLAGLASISELVIDSGIDMNDKAARFGDEGAARIAACPALRGLRVLRLVNGTIGDRGLTAIAAAEWPALETLDLRLNAIGPASVEALLASPLAGQLSELRMEDNELGDAGALRIVKSPLPLRATVAIGERAFTEAVGRAILEFDAVHGLSVTNTFWDEALEAQLAAKFGERLRLH